MPYSLYLSLNILIQSSGYSFLYEELLSLVYDSLSGLYKLKKLVYVLLDGVGDRPNPDLNNITPLEAALTPNLDILARQGVTGMVCPVSKGISPESDIAVFSMLGYNVLSEYPGRGVIEAIGLGCDFKNGDLAVRGNFATLDKNGAIQDRRVGRNLLSSESQALSQEINEQVKLSFNANFTLTPSISHRAVLTIDLPEGNLSGMISNTDPAYDRIGNLGVVKEGNTNIHIQDSHSLDNKKNSKLAAQLVNEFSRKAIEVLKNSTVNKKRIDSGLMPGNAILLRDAGSELPIISSLNSRLKRKCACIADMPVERGVAKIIGIDSYAAGDLRNYVHKARKTIELLNKYSIIYVHLKGPDEPGHDGDSKKKKRSIEEIDSDFFGTLIPKLNLNNTGVIVSADHSTPCILKGHSSDNVPLLISGGSTSRDSVCRFTEKLCSSGKLGQLNGTSVLSKAIKIIEIDHK